MSEDALLILASESPRRRELMKALGVDFQVCPAAIDEEKLHREVKTPEELAQKLALAKARAVYDEHPGSVVLGADTLVCLGSRIFGKPADAREAREMLLALRGRPHRVITGLALVGPGAMTQMVAHVGTSVLMRSYSEEEMAVYIASGSPLDKAGAYGIQDVNFHPAAPVNGCYFNVVGLPICATSELLRQVGIKPRIELGVASACISHRCPFAGLGP